MPKKKPAQGKPTKINATVNVRKEINNGKVVWAVICSKHKEVGRYRTWTSAATARLTHQLTHRS